ncbi:hypothetical protein OPV22_018894 [Ensete ventricosum]|uniref:Isochorismatase-like domain-containing protein n=1 Tax=Ensete ventricosum TaxID=4639 RepID=A0AAV8R185_ENSVE|nr:hypothetical protein OPV22_018894 [Ensete ventricosum]
MPTAAARHGNYLDHKGSELEHLHDGGRTARFDRVLTSYMYQWLFDSSQAAETCKCIILCDWQDDKFAHPNHLNPLNAFYLCLQLRL